MGGKILIIIFIHVIKDVNGTQNWRSSNFIRKSARSEEGLAIGCTKYIRPFPALHVSCKISV